MNLELRNLNSEPEPGTGTRNRNPEPGTGTWNRNLEPGTRNLEPKSVAYDSCLSIDGIFSTCPGLILSGSVNWSLFASKIRM
jgi:hypothetical protein